MATTPAFPAIDAAIDFMRHAAAGLEAVSTTPTRKAAEALRQRADEAAAELAGIVAALAEREAGR